MGLNSQTILSQRTQAKGTKNMAVCVGAIFISLLKRKRKVRSLLARSVFKKTHNEKSVK